jgi:hypothetical protein
VLATSCGAYDTAAQFFLLSRSSCSSCSSISSKLATENTDPIMSSRDRSRQTPSPQSATQQCTSSWPGDSRFREFEAARPKSPVDAILGRDLLSAQSLGLPSIRTVHGGPKIDRRGAAQAESSRGSLPATRAAEVPLFVDAAEASSLFPPSFPPSTQAEVDLTAADRARLVSHIQSFSPQAEDHMNLPVPVKSRHKLSPNEEGLAALANLEALLSRSKGKGKRRRGRSPCQPSSDIENPPAGSLPHSLERPDSSGDEGSDFAQLPQAKTGFVSDYPDEDALAWESLRARGKIQQAKEDYSQLDRNRLLESWKNNEDDYLETTMMPVLLELFTARERLRYLKKKQAPAQVDSRSPVQYCSQIGEVLQQVRDPRVRRATFYETLQVLKGQRQNPAKKKLIPQYQKVIKEQDSLIRQQNQASGGKKARTTTKAERRSMGDAKQKGDEQRAAEQRKRERSGGNIPGPGSAAGDVAERIQQRRAASTIGKNTAGGTEQRAHDATAGARTESTAGVSAEAARDATSVHTKGKTHSPEAYDQAMTLWRKKMTVSDIARKTQIPYSTVQRWVKIKTRKDMTAAEARNNPVGRDPNFTEP